MSKDKREKKRGSSIITKSVGKGKGAQWSKEVASKRSSNMYGGVDDT